MHKPKTCHTNIEDTDTRYVSPNQFLITHALCLPPICDLVCNLLSSEPRIPKVPIRIPRPATWTKWIKSGRERIIPPTRSPPSPSSWPVPGRQIIRVPGRDVQIREREVPEKRRKKGRWEEERRRTVADARTGTIGGRPGWGDRWSAQNGIPRGVRLSAALGVHRSVHRGIG